MKKSFLFKTFTIALFFANVVLPNGVFAQCEPNCANITYSASTLESKSTSNIPIFNPEHVLGSPSSGDIFLSPDFVVEFSATPYDADNCSYYHFTFCNTANCNDNLMAEAANGGTSNISFTGTYGAAIDGGYLCTYLHCFETGELLGMKHYGDVWWMHPSLMRLGASVTCSSDKLNFSLNPYLVYNSATYTVTSSAGTVSPSSASTGTSTSFALTPSGQITGDFTITIEFTDGSGFDMTIPYSGGACGAATCTTPASPNIGATPGTVEIGGTVALNATATGTDGSTTYSWTVNGGTLSDNSIANPTWTAPQTPGNYTLSVIISNGTGCETSISTGVSVACAAPTNAQITATPTSVLPGGAVALSAAADNTNGFTTYLWVGDGSFDNTQNSAPTWTAPTKEGVYTLEVTVSNGAGCSVTVTVDIIVTSSATAALGNFVWFDENDNGVQDPTEKGVDGITVNLYIDNEGDGIPDGTPDRSMVTAGGGFYHFTNLTPGIFYIVEFIAPSKYGVAKQFSADASGTTDDSDAHIGTGLTKPIVLLNGEDNLDIDAGLVFVSFCGRAWEDVDGNGVIGASDLFIEGVTVSLFDANDATVGETATASDGTFRFANLTPGVSYYISFDESTNTGGTIFASPTSQNTSGSSDITDTGDSDIAVSTKKTEVVPLAADEQKCNIDGGFLRASLPVELMYFRAAANGCDIELQWATASEVDNQKFELEHSSDGRKFTSLHSIKGAGNSNNVNAYTYRHVDAPGLMNYYRLKQTAGNGKVEYSDVVYTKSACRLTGKSILSVYPNPVATGQNVNIAIATDATSDASIEILDMFGRIIKSQRIRLAAGDNLNSVSINELAQGVYFMKAKGTDWDTPAVRFIKVDLK
jgi:hypothetical protein